MKNSYEIGSIVYLRAPTEIDVAGSWYTWLSDPVTSRFLVDRNLPNTEAMQKIFLAERLLSPKDLLLAVVDIETDLHIGIASLSNINWVHRYADVAILIGEPTYRNLARYGIEAFDLILRVAFNRLNLRNLTGAYVSANESSRALLGLFGFQQVGCVPALYQYGPNEHDSIVVALSRDDWCSRY